MVHALLVGLALVAGVVVPATSTAAAAAAGVLAGVGPGPGTGIGIRLVDVPTAAAQDPRARAYIVDHLRPGAVIHRRIEVRNGTPAPARVVVYPAAAAVSTAGFVGAQGHTGNELSSWTTATPNTLVLPAGKGALVAVTIKVPAKAVAGEDYAVLWAQVTTPPRTPGGVIQVSRVGIRLYASIGPGGAPRSDFTIVSMTAARGADSVPQVQAAVRNTGQRALDLDGTLRLSHGPGGLSAGPFPVTVGRTLGIGDTEPLLVRLDRALPAGPWQASIAVTSGTTTRTAQATITFPAGPGTAHPVPARAASAVPWAAITAATLAALLLLVLLVLARRRTHRRPNRPAPTPTQQQDQSQSLTRTGR